MPPLLDDLFGMYVFIGPNDFATHLAHGPFATASLGPIVLEHILKATAFTIAALRDGS